MKDLLLHENTEFIKPTIMTEDERAQISQAYISLFLTYLGSIDVDPDVGISSDISRMSTARFRLESQIINSDIFQQLRDIYDLTAIRINSLEEIEDQVRMSVTISTNTLSTEVSLTV